MCAWAARLGSQLRGHGYLLAGLENVVHRQSPQRLFHLALELRGSSPRMLGTGTFSPWWRGGMSARGGLAAGAAGACERGDAAASEGGAVDALAAGAAAWMADDTCCAAGDCMRRDRCGLLARRWLGRGALGLLCRGLRIHARLWPRPGCQRRRNARPLDAAPRPLRADGNARRGAGCDVGYVGRRS